MKQVLFLLGLVFLVHFNGYCQSWGDSTIKNGPVFYSVEEAPKFPGVWKDITNFFQIV
jgi:hypothetical protein